MLSILVILLNQVEKKTFPSFESFIIEEEEGSGINIRTLFFINYRTDKKIPY
jgi:hypothetical protein